MDRAIIEDVLVFAGVVTAMAIFGKIVLTFLSRHKNPPRALEEINARLARIEQAVDATSLEVERVAEAQRFTTKLLAERNPMRESKE